MYSSIIRQWKKNAQISCYSQHRSSATTRIQVLLIPFYQVCLHFFLQFVHILGRLEILACICSAEGAWQDYVQYSQLLTTASSIGLEFPSMKGWTRQIFNAIGSGKKHYEAKKLMPRFMHTFTQKHSSLVIDILSLKIRLFKGTCFISLLFHSATLSLCLSLPVHSTK